MIFQVHVDRAGYETMVYTPKARLARTLPWRSFVELDNDTDGMALVVLR